MLRDITLDSTTRLIPRFHRLDPRNKIIWNSCIHRNLIYRGQPLGHTFAATIFLITAISSNVPVKFMVRGLKSIMFLLLPQRQL